MVNVYNILTNLLPKEVVHYLHCIITPQNSKLKSQKDFKYDPSGFHG